MWVDRVEHAVPSVRPVGPADLALGSRQALKNYMLFLLGFMSGVSGGEGSRPGTRRSKGATGRDRPFDRRIRATEGGFTRLWVEALGETRGVEHAGRPRIPEVFLSVSKQKVSQVKMAFLSPPWFLLSPAFSAEDVLLNRLATFCHLDCPTLFA